MILTDNETKFDLLDNEAIEKRIEALLREWPELPAANLHLILGGMSIPSRPGRRARGG